MPSSNGWMSWRTSAPSIQRPVTADRSRGAPCTAEESRPIDPVSPAGTPTACLAAVLREEAPVAATSGCTPTTPPTTRGTGRGVASVVVARARGAFAGNSPQEAFRLRVDSSVNTPQSIDAGRLIIEIAVAPAQPMRFLTVRLVQSGERFSVAEA